MLQSPHNIPAIPSASLAVAAQGTACVIGHTHILNTKVLDVIQHVHFLLREFCYHAALPVLTLFFNPAVFLCAYLDAMVIPTNALSKLLFFFF